MNAKLNRCVSLITFALFFGGFSWADIKTEKVEYRDGRVRLEGILAVDEKIKGKRPGILVVHEWKGQNDYAERRARELAQLGYAAFALDMYGKGVLHDNTKDAAEWSDRFKKDRDLMRRRASKGLEVLLKDPRVDKSKVAAIGYCFGGTTVLELARMGSSLNGVVSFHGGLETSKPAKTGVPMPTILVLHGADDPYVPDEEVNDFIKEMRESGANWELTMYADAVHGFTNSANGTDKSTGAAYNETADRKSWRAMKIFFEEIFR